MEKLNQYIHEISSFEYLKTSEARHRNYYRDNNFNPIELVRLPKYSQLGTYEETIKKISEEAYTEVLLFEDFKIKKVLHRFNEIELKFKNQYCPFFKKWHKIFTQHIGSFDFSDFIIYFFFTFEISHPKGAFGYNGQDGDYGRVEIDLFSDLQDALMLKQSSIQHIIRQLTDYLESSNSNKTLALNVNRPNRKKSNISNEPNNSKSNETLSQQLIHDNKINIAKAIHTKYKGIEGFKGVYLRILLEALRELDLFSTGRTDAIFYRCCFNDFGNIGSYQAMEKKVFKKGYHNSKGLYIKHEHEVIFDNTIKFLESIINTK
jgi:hypothetical protein